MLLRQVPPMIMRAECLYHPIFLSCEITGQSSVSHKQEIELLLFGDIAHTVNQCKVLVKYILVVIGKIYVDMDL